MKVLETISIEQDNVNDESVIIKNLYFETGDHIEKGSLLIDYETSKASHEIFSSESGYVEYIYDIDAVVKVGTEILRIHESPIEITTAEDQPELTKEPMFSKKALAKIKELGIDKELFMQYDKITEDFVIEQYESSKTFHQVLDISPTKKEEIKNLYNPSMATLVSTVGKKIKPRVLDLDDLYKNSALENSLLPIIIEQLASILAEENTKIFNSYCEDDKIYVYKDVNAGIALNFGDGLRIGVIKNVDKKSLVQIEENLFELIDKYIERKLTIEDISNATFTITDLTDQGIDSFAPLIKNQNSIMVGLCGQKNVEQLVSVTFDHRVTDGLAASQLLNLLYERMVSAYGGLLDEYSCSRCMKNLDEILSENNVQGLVQIMDVNGINGYICETCLDGK
jgi:pyruvate/2-oxoglutarate dehydrogenase complex dihydrolipoamide acyltransferase (E2) component